nr:SusD/RagB family nutrient-binding outer membrane lipoprotein [Lewinella sp. IMCC34183]
MAEAAAKGWTDGDVEELYREGILASMDYWQVDFGPFGYDGFADYYDNSGVAYESMTDIWEQKWLALFFTGLEPYFELRRWYVASGKSFDGVPFVSATCENLNDDRLPLRFLYPGQEQSLNAANYEQTVNDLGGNTQNAEMWLVE